MVVNYCSAGASLARKQQQGGADVITQYLESPMGITGSARLCLQPAARARVRPHAVCKDALSRLLEQSTIARPHMSLSYALAGFAC